MYYTSYINFVHYTNYIGLIRPRAQPGAKAASMPQGIARGIGAFLFSNTGAKNKTYYYITYDYYTSFLYYTYYTNLNYINYFAGSCRPPNESVMLLV